MTKKWIFSTVLAMLVAVSVLGANLSGTVATTYNVAAHSKPTIALANLGAGLVDSGAHTYLMTRVNAGGETLAGTASASITTDTATNGKVNVTIPALIADQTSYNLYRTKAGAATYYLITTGTHLAPGVFVDNIDDASLSATEPPILDTTSPTIAAPDAPVVALANLGAGNGTSGTHVVKVAYVTASGIGAGSTSSDPVTVSTTTNGKINVTVVASTNPLVTSINIYESKAGTTTPLYLAASGVANANGTTVLNVADASLTVEESTADASAVDTVVDATAWGFSYIRLVNLDASLNVYVSFDDTVVDTTNGMYIPPTTSAPYNILIISTCKGLQTPIRHIRMRTTTGSASVQYQAFE